jgi:succinate-acetate transporter protein
MARNSGTFGCMTLITGLLLFFGGCAGVFAALDERDKEGAAFVCLIFCILGFFVTVTGYKVYKK